MAGSSGTAGKSYCNSPFTIVQKFGFKNVICSFSKDIFN